MLRFRSDPATLIYGSLSSADGHRALIRGLAEMFASHHLSLQLDAIDHRHLTQGDFDASGVEHGDMTRIAAIHPVQSPWFASPAAKRLPELGVMSDDATGVTQQELAKTDFHHFILQPFDIAHSFVMYLGGSAAGAMTLGISRSRRAGAYRPEELDTAHGLLPHLRNVISLQNVIANGLLDGLQGRHAIWVLSKDGRIRARNGLAHDHPILGERANQPIPAHPADRPAFTVALERVLSGTQLRAQLCLRDASGIPACMAQLNHCKREAFLDWLLPDPPAVLLSLHPLSGDSAELEPVLTRLFALTAAECRVATGMLELASPHLVASSLCRSEETVRSQLKAIYAKTGVHSQAELIKLLFRLS